MKMSVVYFARQVLAMDAQVLAMDAQIRSLEKRLERAEGFERKYNDLLNSSIAAQQNSANNMLRFAMALGEDGMERLRGTLPAGDETEEPTELVGT